MAPQTLPRRDALRTSTRPDQRSRLVHIHHGDALIQALTVAGPTRRRSVTQVPRARCHASSKYEQPHPAQNLTTAPIPPDCRSRIQGRTPPTVTGPDHARATKCRIPDAGRCSISLRAFGVVRCPVEPDGGCAILLSVVGDVRTQRHRRRLADRPWIVLRVPASAFSLRGCQVSRNDSSEIRLSSNPSTGYSWTSVPTPGIEVGNGSARGKGSLEWVDLDI